MKNKLGYQLLICCFFFICSLSVAGAEEMRTVNTGKTTFFTKLSLEDCLRIAHKQNPNFLSYYENHNALKEKEAITFRAMLPSASVSWSDTEKKYSYDIYSADVTITQPLYQGKSLYTQWKLSQMDAGKADLEVQRQSQLITFSVKVAWFKLLEAIELQAETEKSLERLRKHVSNAKLFFKEGWIWHTDVLQAEVTAARGEQAMIIADNDVARAQARLNTLLHRESTAPIEPQGKLEKGPSSWTYERAKKEALANRLDLAQAHIDMERSQASLSLAKGSYWPSVQIEASMSRWGDTFKMIDGVKEHQIALTASYKLWEWNRTGKKIAVAKAQIRQSNLKIAHLKDRIQLELEEAWLAVQEAAKKIHVLEQALEQGEENYRVNKIRYRERLGTAKDVLDALELLTNTRKDYISAISSYMIALSGLDFFVGTKS